MIVLVLLVLLFFLPAIFLVPAVIGPTLAAASGRQLRLRFALGDMLWLMAMLQYPLLVFTLLVKNGSPYRDDFRYFISGILCLMVVAVWGRGVAMLNALEVTGSWRRGAFLVGVLPLTIALPLIVGPSLVVAMSSGGAAAQWGRGVFVGILLALYPLRMLNFWVLAGESKT